MVISPPTLLLLMVTLQIRLAGLVYHEADLLVKASKKVASQCSSFTSHTGLVGGGDHMVPWSDCPTVANEP